MRRKRIILFKIRKFFRKIKGRKKLGQEIAPKIKNFEMVEITTLFKTEYTLFYYKDRSSYKSDDNITQAIFENICTHAISVKSPGEIRGFVNIYNDAHQMTKATLSCSANKSGYEHIAIGVGQELYRKLTEIAGTKPKKKGPTILQKILRMIS